ncbi:MAG: 23S rRNA (adenine(2503)-C(2))-methyltransferase RlmN [Synechococcus sp.]|nr:23S rRNA (adenine(2503)-C(2))-methyltransferase RlmN [Synechococcus sp.]
MPRPLLGLGLPELQAWCVEQGQPAFRARQLHEWIYDRGARSLAAITVLPKAWRQQLTACAGDRACAPAAAVRSVPSTAAAASPACESPPVVSAAAEPPAVAAVIPAGAAPVPAAPAAAPVATPGVPPAPPSAADGWIGRSRELLRSESRDGTVKLLLGTADGLSLETVGIPSGERLTVCVSSQVGCPMACRFCATGKGGLQRSLALHEIVDQVLSIRELMGRRPSHVVFMGMGEPLLNLEAVLAAIDCLCTDLGMAQRQITISTVGVPAALPSLAERALQRLGRAQFTLAVSLHAPDQALRQRLIPTAHAYPIEQLLDDCRRYVAITGRRVSFEYILLGGVNDQPHHAEALARRLRGFQSHVNLIAYNPIVEEDFRRPSPEAVEAFRRGLQERRIAVSVRASRGLDADAACGQLRRRLVGEAPAARHREGRLD